MKGKRRSAQITQCPDPPREHHIQNYEKKNSCTFKPDTDESSRLHLEVHSLYLRNALYNQHPFLISTARTV